MSEPAPGFDEQSGAATISPSGWRALLALTGPDSAAPPDEAAVAELAEAGVLAGGELHPALAPAVLAVHEASHRLFVTRGGLEAEGWLADDAAALLVPRAEELLELVGLPPHYLPDALARLVDLRPLPAAERQAATVSAAELARLIASREGDARLGTVREHWLVEVRANSGEPRARLEAIETDAGLWRLEGVAEGVRCLPADPSALWRALTSLPLAGFQGPGQDAAPAVPGTRYSHPGLGFSLELPESALVLVELPLMVALHPQREWSFQPNMVVTAEPVSPGTDPHDWVEASLRGQDSVLEAARRIDRATTGLAGRPAVRTLSHHLHEGHAVTLEQWRLVEGGRGWVLSASCGTLDYGALADDFARVAAGFEP